ncbi:DUF4097 domain-containing protein [Metabacillus sp. GX 13764]|uniref:DUF4097 family beta strand repeat-containing protein n=1 Tax=Metabacillus kandeliae TaxID=2900151 RepID=UPI001E286BD4|nr:DUF4097 domain-containing protein [Metabacillus kandeliae]MCD7035895.1 DUF4097 domain-containing protein [Metabacillus kandeliae]
MKEERKRILKLVEEGKLSVDEALSLIESLESESKEKMKKVNLAKEYDFYEEPKQKTAGIGTKLTEWIDTAVKKVKELDIDLAFGSYLDVHHVYQIPALQVNELDVDLMYGSINVKPWNETEIRIECDAKIYRVNTLEEARNVFLSNMECRPEGSRLAVRTDKKSMKVNITMMVPQKVYEKAKFKLFSGPIRGEQLSLKDSQSKTANGVISFVGLSGEKAEFETANGQIKLAQHRIKKVEAETINGLIETAGESERLDLQSFNGNIAVQEFNPESSAIHVKTTTGSIDLQLPLNTAVSGELKSNLGALHPYLQQMEIISEKNDAIQKELRFRANTAEQGELNVFAETKTGSITAKHMMR